MRVVLDTNVIVSGLNFPGNERRVLELARRRRFELYLSEFIQREVAGVLTRKFGWDANRSFQALGMPRNAATMIEPRRRTAVIENSHADNRILDCVVEARADCLITGDRRHLLPLAEHRGARIVNAPRFLTRLGE